MREPKSPGLRRSGVRLGALLWLLSSAAYAEPQAAASTACKTQECGRALFKQGVTAYQAGEYTAAIKHFRAALAIKRHPAVLLNLALAEARSGQVVEATAHFQEVEQDAQASASLRQSAQDERALAEQKIAWVQLEQADSDATLEINGAPARSMPRGTPVNPGRHQLRVTRDGAVVEREVVLAAGETLRMSLARARELVLVMPGQSARAAREPRPEPKPEEARKPLEPVWVYAGVGVTLLLGGFATWSALDTQSAYDQYEADLPRLTQAEIDSQVSDGHARERRTNWLLGGTLLSSVVTGVLAGVFVDWGAPRVSVRAERRAGAVTLSGAF